MLIPPNNSRAAGGFSLRDTLVYSFAFLFLNYIVSLLCVFLIYLCVTFLPSGSYIYKLFYVDFIHIVPSTVGTAIIISSVRSRQNLNSKDYLGFKKFTKKELINWTFLLVLFIVVESFVTYLVNPPGQMEILAAYRERFIPLVYLSVIVVAPVYEEVLFRAFMIQGIRNSRLGSAGAIVVTALLFALMHYQYNTYYKFWVFGTGIFLGIAKIQTNSTYLSITLHSLMNLYAVTYILVYIHIFRG